MAECETPPFVRDRRSSSRRRHAPANRHHTPGTSRLRSAVKRGYSAPSASVSCRSSARMRTTNPAPPTIAAAKRLSTSPLASANRTAAPSLLAGLRLVAVLLRGLGFALSALVLRLLLALLERFAQQLG